MSSCASYPTPALRTVTVLGSARGPDARSPRTSTRSAVWCSSRPTRPWRRVSPSHSTVSTPVIPTRRCSVMWEGIIHFPRFDTSTSRSTVEPTRRRTVSVHTRLVARTHLCESTLRPRPCRRLGCGIGGGERGAVRQPGAVSRRRPAGSPVDGQALPARGRCPQDPRGSRDVASQPIIGIAPLSSTGWTPASSGSSVSAPTAAPPGAA